MEKILLFGNGGHAKVVSDLVEKEGRYQVLASLDKDSEASFPTFKTQLGIIAVGDNALRASIAKKILAINPNFKFVSSVHPSAQLGKGVELGEGTVVMAGAVINPFTIVGNHCVINTRASVDHDCRILDFATIGPGAVLGGDVEVGSHSFIGLGSSVIQGIKIGKNTVIGAGSVVVKPLGDNLLAYGVPCRVVRNTL